MPLNMKILMHFQKSNLIHDYLPRELANGLQYVSNTFEYRDCISQVAPDGTANNQDFPQPTYYYYR